MTLPTAGQLASYALAGALVLVVLRQCRKPSWWPGRFFVSIMNVSHAGVTQWGLSHVQVEKNFAVLDVGCGGGRTIHTLADRVTEGKVYGIDYSETSVAAARRTNKEGIESVGRVEIRQASVSSLPFPDRTFDLVTAVETHYYWPEPVADLREILRVLKPGGRLVIIAETYKGQRFGWIVAAPMKLLGARYMTVREHQDLFAAAGYSEITIDVKQGKGWLCGVGRRAVAPAA